MCLVLLLKYPYSEMKLTTAYVLVAFLPFILSAQVALAAPIDAGRAHKIASTFLGPQMTKTRGASDLRLVYTSQGSITRGVAAEQPLYYVFERQEGNGFVIVAGDDQAEEILGYSAESSFGAGQLSPQLVYWLDQCARSVRQAMERGHRFEAPLRGGEKPIYPLLRGLRWNQNSPFNDLAPKIDDKRAPSGCVATALAQIMRYWCWPIKAKGQVEYENEADSKTIKATLGQKTYDWANMPSYFGKDATDKQKEAVAFLHYEIGVASHMQYEANGSGAFTRDAAKAMRENFQYSKSLAYVQREFYNRGEWEQLIINELKAGRPVLYCGATSSGGHAFVCDGYDGKGLFHINWGWGGRGNGYFSTLDLKPDSQGIGGAEGGGFSIGQELLMGIEPQPVATLPPAYKFFVDSISCSNDTFKQSQRQTATLHNFFSMTVDPVKAIAGLALYDSQGKQLQVFQGKTRITFHGIYYYKGEYNVSFYLDNIPDGRYQLRPVAKVDGNGDEWIPVDTYKRYDCIVDVTIAAGEVKLSSDAKPARLEAQVISTKITQDGITPIRVLIRNTSATEYNSLLAMRQIHSRSDTINVADTLLTGKSQTDYVYNSSLCLPAGQSVEIETLLRGPKDKKDTYLHVLYDEYNGYRAKDTLQKKPNVVLAALTQKTIAVQQLEVQDAQPEDGVPEAKITFQQVRVEVGKELKCELEVTIPSYSKNFAGSIIGFIFPIERGLNLDYYTPRILVMAIGESKTLTLEREIFLPAGEYFVQFYYKNSIVTDWTKITTSLGEDVYFTFTVTGTLDELPVRKYEGGTGSEDPSNGGNPVPVELPELPLLELHPNPASNYFAVSGVLESQLLEIYSVDGRLVLQNSISDGDRVDVSTLPNGAYIVRMGGRAVRLLVRK